MMEFKKIVALANKVGLLKTYSKVNVEQLRPGPVGLLLEEILRTEWLNAIVINKDLTVFLSEDDFTGTYEFARSMCLESLPFGVAEIINNKKWSIQDVMGNYKQNGELEFSKLFVNTNSSTLKCTILVAPNISTQFFHQWQRQRNMWWRKSKCLCGIIHSTNNAFFTNLDVVGLHAYTAVLRTDAISTESAK